MWKFSKRYRPLMQVRIRLHQLYAQLQAPQLFAGKKILVLAPHPDDEVFGCGGALIKHVQAGHEIQVVYLTSGEQGIAGKMPTETIEIREREAQNALEIMGIPAKNAFFFRGPDGALHDKMAEMLQKTQQVLQNFQPDLIYLPSFLDRHADHFTANRLLQAALVKNVQVAAYEIWTPHIPNRLIDISRQIAIKQKAMQAYASQLAQLDYEAALLGLNRYRGGMYTNPEVVYAEAYMYLRSDVYFAEMPASY